MSIKGRLARLGFWTIHASLLLVVLVPFQWQLVLVWFGSHLARAVGGAPWLVWGFCLATVTLAHSTFAINTVNHMWGSRRFSTKDRSTNNPITALLAAGESHGP